MVAEMKIRDAAIKLPSGFVATLPRPNRHSDILMQMMAAQIKASEGTQGFITSNGVFVTREEAYKIAHAAGQIIFQDGVTPTPGTLYTEDLW